MKRSFLATVDQDIELTDAFKKILKDQGVEILAYYKRLNVLKLASEKDLRKMNLKPFKNIELDQEVSAQQDDSN